MGLRALRKVERIVREEMDRAGAIEVSMPLIQPTDIWHASGRYEAMRDALYKVKDRANKEWALSPTDRTAQTAPGEMGILGFGGRQGHPLPLRRPPGN